MTIKNEATQNLTQLSLLERELFFCIVLWSLYSIVLLRCESGTLLKIQLDPGQKMFASL